MIELVVGSRGSKLALKQTGMVVDDLVRLTPGLSCRLEVIKTLGDKITDVPLAQIGDKGLFVKEIEQALLDGTIDFAVHSAKDLPSETDERLCVAAYPQRVDPRDALVSKVGTLAQMPAGSTIGTSSVRRRAQLLHVRPDLNVADLRGNLDTRLRKLESEQYDAVVLACAGLIRMELESVITEALPVDVCLPASGQGSLGIQCRTGDPALEIIGKLDHQPTRQCVTAERALLAAMGAGCQTPVAALAQIVDGELRVDAVVASLTGAKLIRMSEAGDIGSPEDVGKRLADRLLNSPARELLEEARVSDRDGMGAA